MDEITSSEDLINDIKIKTSQEHLLLDIIKELCNDSKLSPKVRGKVSRIIADNDLASHSNLNKINIADENTSTLLGFMQQSTSELTYEEQAELNQAIIKKIQDKVPVLTHELESLKQISTDSKKSRKRELKELQNSLDEKLNTLKEQENEKVDLMMEWLNHSLNDVATFSDSSAELITLKTKILELKSKILHLQILQNIFTETNKSIEAYKEIHKDLQEAITETEAKIKHFNEIIESDY